MIMGTFIVKQTGDNDRWYKLVDQVENEEYEGINLTDAVDYDPNNTVTGQWFKIDGFNEKEGFLTILDQDFDVADLDSLTSDQFSQHQIDFVAYYKDHRYYIQKFTSGSFMKRKWLAWGGEAVEYFENDGLIYVNPIPNCIYDNTEKRIYFMDITKAYSVFKELKLDYEAATDVQTTQMLQTDLIRTEGFDASGVGLSNRKRITSILAKYNQYREDQKDQLRDYIKEKVGNNLPYDEESKKFVIANDTQLRLLLFGVQQRFYQPPLENEVQVATATTKLSSLL